MRYKVKNWSKHQHFKDRTPPWIKLYRDILDDPDWHDLDGDTAKILVSIWLIASEDDTKEGFLPEARKLAFRLRIKPSQLENAINRLSNWLICVDIEPISPRYRDVCASSQKNTVADVSDHLETETETEKETEVEKETDCCAAPLRVTLPAIVSIPLNDRTEFEANQSHVDEWATAYPAVNVVQKLREMRAWCLANPTNRKTRRGVEAFINRWLAKDQNRSGNTAKPAETFAERDERNAKEKWQRMTGQVHPDLAGGLPQHLNIIEAEPIVRIAA